MFGWLLHLRIAQAKKRREGLCDFPGCNYAHDEDSTTQKAHSPHTETTDVGCTPFLRPLAIPFKAR